MATIEITSLQSTHCLGVDNELKGELWQLTFYVSGTYAAGGDGIQITDIPGLMQTHRRTPGLDWSLVDVCRGHWPATKDGYATMMSLKTVTVSGDNVTALITDGDETTELSSGAVPAQGRPFSIICLLRES